jgi:hypothetical protein
MTDQTPVETVAEAVRANNRDDDTTGSMMARAALASLARHRDDIAQAIHETRDTRHRETRMCAGGPTARHSCWAAADAILAYLTGGAR